jgi:PDZ domain-containing secreted protein
MFGINLVFDLSRKVDAAAVKIKEGQHVYRSFYDSVIDAKDVAERVTKRHFIRDITVEQTDGDDFISGGSGGLVLALRFISRLVEDRDLSCDRITGSGALDSRGNVLPILHLEEKAAAAYDAGYRVFLCSAEQELPDCKDHSEQAIQYVRVHTVEQAWAIVSKCPCAGCEWNRRRGRS